MVTAIVGANWGDEGKGKITDMLAQQSDVVIRFQGGANAGHTIINDYGRFALHILPSGTFYPHVTNIIGNGVALDVDKLVKELRSLTDQGVPAPNLMVSDRAQLLMPYHVLQDTYEEERLGGRAFGSTKSGIAPFYSDKYAKTGIQVADLWNEERLKGQLEHICTLKNVLMEHLYHKPLLDPKALFDELMGYRAALEPYVGDAVTFVHQALKDGKQVLLEGQLGSMKDPNLGICPMTTSSHTLAGFGTVGGGVPPTAIQDIVTVTKAYSSAVGPGPLSVSSSATRPRSCGSGAATPASTAPPPAGPAVWAGSTRWPPSTAAWCRAPPRWPSPPSTVWATWTRSRCAPATTSAERSPRLPRARPAGSGQAGVRDPARWKCDIRGITEYGKLPQAARDYVDFIEKHIEAPITIVSTGPKRHEICYRK